jgi:hypothetical protein
LRRQQEREEVMAALMPAAPSTDAAKDKKK